MEALGIQFSPISALNLAQRARNWNRLPVSALVPISACSSFSNFKIRRKCRGGPGMQVVEEEYELKQMRDMAAARKRWEALAWVKGSTWIPIFNVDERLDAGTISRKITDFMMGAAT